MPDLPRLSNDLIQQLRGIFFAKDRSPILSQSNWLGLPLLVSTPTIFPLVDNYYFYFKTDGNLYRLDWDGNEVQLNVNEIIDKLNAIINGDFNIWQRATSFASVASGVYVADRFQYQKTGAMVHTITQDTDVPTVAESGHQSNYSLKIDCTTTDTAISTGDFVTLSQSIEGFNILPLVSKTVYLSFWVKATKTGIYCISFKNSGNDKSYVIEYTINLSDTWERKNINLPFVVSGGTWNYTNGVGLNLSWVLAAGTTYHTTPNIWQNGNFLATLNQVNACDSTANDFYLSQVQLRAVNVDYYIDDRLFDAELSACQRYYEVMGGDNALNTIQMEQYKAGVANLISTVYFRVTKRATPTVTKNGTWVVFNCGQPTVDNPSRNTCRIIATSTGAANATFATNSADDTITIDAEL